jgi:predicted ester cyclase
MSKEDVERIDDQGMAAWDSHDAQGFVNIFADDFVVNDVAMPEPITEKDGVREYAQAWFTAFPDMSVKQTNRVMMAGKEIPPTGRTVIGRGTYFARVRDGKVVEFNSYPDIAGMMMQLGFMPEM